ncbi:hypothetical protein BANRA_02620 [Acinetobacter baumannii]|nr:hypothetical protein BANRA_02620 [Acinetobacter baumannii]
MQAVVYHSQDIQAWEQRWFAAQNSSLGLMQQAAWSITQQLIVLFQNKILRILLFGADRVITLVMAIL